MVSVELIEEKIAVNQHFQAAWRILPSVRARVTRRNQEAGKNAAGQIGVLLDPGLRGLTGAQVKALGGGFETRPSA